jgi:Flp pilus assembly protein TadD
VIDPVDPAHKKLVQDYTKLTDDDRQHLTIAQGYYELGMIEDSVAELNLIAPESRQTLPVLEAWLSIYLWTERWSDAVKTARCLVEKDPSQSLWMTDLAYATRRAESLDAAKTVLLQAIRRFPKVALVHYNLGCYEAQLGNLTTARELVKKAIKIDRSFRKTAIEDPDLEPLWQQLQSS